MIHNAMLYGYMQTLGEGFELLEKSEFDYDLEHVADSLSKSSVIRGWLFYFSDRNTCIDYLIC